MGIAAPARVQEQAIFQRLHAQGRSPSIYDNWRGAKAVGGSEEMPHNFFEAPGLKHVGNSVLISLVNLACSAGPFGGRDYQTEKAMSNQLF
jgi:hypothetical protein